MRRRRALLPRVHRRAQRVDVGAGGRDERARRRGDDSGRAMTRASRFIGAGPVGRAGQVRAPRRARVRERRGQRGLAARQARRVRPRRPRGPRDRDAGAKRPAWVTTNRTWTWGTRGGTGFAPPRGPRAKVRGGRLGLNASDAGSLATPAGSRLAAGSTPRRRRIRKVWACAASGSTVTSFPLGTVPGGGDRVSLRRGIRRGFRRGHRRAGVGARARRRGAKEPVHGVAHAIARDA